MHRNITVFEVSHTPESEKYIKYSALWHYLGKPVSRRLAWAGALVLSMGASTPLLFKAALNLINSTVDRHSLREAKKNLIGAVTIPFIGGIISTLSIIMPTYIGARIIQGIAFAGPRNFRQNSKTPANLRSIREEVGPRDTPRETLAYHVLGNQVHPIHFPPSRIFPEVKGNGITIDTLDIPCEEKDAAHSKTRYRLCFNATSSYYQKHLDRITSQYAKLKLFTRLFNYPSVTKPDEVDSFVDLINAGIAEVYDLAERFHLSNAQLEETLHLYGYCSGAAVALPVAAYFKNKHHVNLKVIVDRSYLSLQTASALHLNEIVGMPVWYAKSLSTLVLFASGDFHADSLAAVKTLDPSKIHYINLGHKSVPQNPASLSYTIRQFLGIGSKITQHADQVIPDGATLADALNEARITCGRSTRDIFNGLGQTQEHRFYVANPSLFDHMASLDSLFVDREVTSAAASAFSSTELAAKNRTALDYYAKVLEQDDQFDESKPSSQALRNYCP